MSIVIQLRLTAFCRLSEIDHFQKVLQHPAYKEDALGAISQHISNSVQRGLA